MEQQKTVKKQIVFSEKLYNQLNQSAKLSGVSFPEYIRYLGLKDLELKAIQYESDYISPQAKKRILEEHRRTMNDYANGKLEAYDTMDDMLDSVMNGNERKKDSTD